MTLIELIAYYPDAVDLVADSVVRGYGPCTEESFIDAVLNTIKHQGEDNAICGSRKQIRTMGQYQRRV